MAISSVYTLNSLVIFCFSFVVGFEQRGWVAGLTAVLCVCLFFLQIGNGDDLVKMVRFLIFTKIREIKIYCYTLLAEGDMKTSWIFRKRATGDF